MSDLAKQMYNQFMNTNGSSALLERVLGPAGVSMPEETARWLTTLQPSPDLETRLDELAYKNTEGSLTNDERAEYECTVLLGDIISVLQAKARHILNNART